jgi:hypothetical protein
MAIYRGAGGAGDATGDSASEALLVRTLAVEVAADAAAAEAARAAAVAAQTAAETAETNAETAETNAETAETNAETAATSATSSASSASTSATSAASSASAASTSATNAASSASSASSSASAASTSATNAASSASSASSSASAASTSATNAASSATAAASSASSASTSATNAASSASSASTSATNAATSATAAQTAETNAETAQAAAELAETNAETAETNAETAATNAAASASSASTSATNAASSATSASNSASAAATSATNAANSASAAATSATNAANSATLAASYTPSQTGNAGKYLTTDGTNTSWDALATVANSGSYNDLSDKPTIPTNLDSLSDVVVSSPSTNQVLKYNGTSWVNDTSPSSVSDGDKGDITVSSSGTVWTIDNTTITPAKMANSGAEFGMRNRIINGAMMIDQRNAGAAKTSLTSQYLVDRWIFAADVGSKFTFQQNYGSVTPPSGFSNYSGFYVASAYTPSGNEISVYQQAIEGFNFADMAWGTASAASITLSFWVRSSLTGTFGGAFRNSATTRSYPFSYTISAANTWEQKTVTIAGDTSGTWVGATNGVGVYLDFDLGSANGSYRGPANAWATTTGNGYIGVTSSVQVVANAGATWYITGVQLEKGSTATSFDYRPYGTELALCQRYYQVGDIHLFSGNTSSGDGTVSLPVQMRANPSYTYTDSSGTANTYTDSGGSGQTLSINANSVNTYRFRAQVILARNATWWEFNFKLSAEL